MRLFVCARACLARMQKNVTMLYTKIKREIHAFRLLAQSAPFGVVALFVLSLFAMNLLANKSIALPLPWLALDCGILFSWLSFLAMDVITRRFGPKAATEISIFAVAVNLVFCLILYAASRIPGTWGESYVPGSEALLNRALDRTFGGTWYVLAGSAVAFIVSAFVNNYLNAAIGKCLRRRRDGYFVYALRTYISTAVGQFADNFVFSMLVSRVFFGWTLVQCVVCAITGMLAELLCEVAFSPIGFRVCMRWEREDVGRAYLDFIRQGKEDCA